MKFKDFSDTIRENLDSFEGEYASFIDCGPNLFVLLCDLLDNKKLNKQFRLEINAAIAYFVIPNDVIPEEIYGPYGYIDDIFIASYVLRRIAKHYGYEFIQKQWKLNTKVKDIINDCYTRSLELLEDKVYPILSYSGLVD